MSYEIRDLCWIPLTPTLMKAEACYGVLTLSIHIEKRTAFLKGIPGKKVIEIPIAVTKITDGLIKDLKDSAYQKHREILKEDLFRL